MKGMWVAVMQSIKILRPAMVGEGFECRETDIFLGKVRRANTV
jgi:hypothetical protein